MDDLVRLANAHGKALDHAIIADIVATSDKQRFSLSADGCRIRANQGHSVAVDLKLAALVPPDVLFHGTADRFTDAIRTRGLLPQGRQHVHLSTDRQTAIQVARRHGVPVLVLVDAARMHASGHVFHRSDNGVWLVATVPVDCLRFPD